jgi:hypothetical protein
MKRILPRLIAGRVLLVVIGGALYWLKPPKPPFEVPGSGPVAAFRLEALSDDQPDPSANRFHDWKLLAQIDAISEDQAKQLRQLLSDGSNYSEFASMCFTPSIAFRFGNDATDPMDVLISLDCERIQVRKAGQTTAHPLSKQGVEELKKFCAGVFPIATSATGPTAS